MSDNSNVQIKKSDLNLERIALLAVVGLLSWNVYTTSQLQTDVAVTNTKVEALTLTLTIAAADRYTAAQANADNNLLDARISRNEEWLSNLSRRLADVESTIRESAISAR